jgi:hypothetical protein
MPHDLTVAFFLYPGQDTVAGVASRSNSTSNPKVLPPPLPKIELQLNVYHSTLSRTLLVVTLADPLLLRI